MALLSRTAVLALCVSLAGLLHAAPASARVSGEQAAARTAIPTLPSPARLEGSVPLVVERAERRRALAPGERAVRIAVRELGTPYRYGGSGPGGFDCSGLTSWVFRQLGIDLPHNAAAQYAHGRPVDRRHLRPGDLVFFHGLGHVGLYIGRGRMIHAPQSGERVEVQSLAVRRGSIEGARRIVS